MEKTITKLEAFNVSYDEISSEVDYLLEDLTAFRVSAISSDSLEAKHNDLQKLEEAVPQKRSKQENLVDSSDLLETPYDQSHFRKKVDDSHAKLIECDQVTV